MSSPTRQDKTRFEVSVNLPCPRAHPTHYKGCSAAPTGTTAHQQRLQRAGDGDSSAAAAAAFRAPQDATASPRSAALKLLQLRRRCCRRRRPAAARSTALSCPSAQHCDGGPQEGRATMWQVFLGWLWPLTTIAHLPYHGPHGCPLAHPMAPWRPGPRKVRTAA